MDEIKTQASRKSSKFSAPKPSQVLSQTHPSLAIAKLVTTNNTNTLYIEVELIKILDNFFKPVTGVLTSEQLFSILQIEGGNGYNVVQILSRKVASCPQPVASCPQHFPQDFLDCSSILNIDKESMLSSLYSRCTMDNQYVPYYVHL